MKKLYYDVVKLGDIPTRKTDIGVYMKKEDFIHKLSDGKCYWYLDHLSDELLKTLERLWVASDGAWRGFLLVDPDMSGEGEVHFDSVDFQPIGSVHGMDWDWDVVCKRDFPRKHFQGFTYRVPFQVLWVMCPWCDNLIEKEIEPKLCPHCESKILIKNYGRLHRRER